MASLASLPCVTTLVVIVTAGFEVSPRELECVEGEHGSFTFGLEFECREEFDVELEELEELKVELE